MSNSAFTPTFAQNLQDASATQKGLVNTTTQVFAGKKTFDGGAAIKGDTSGNAVAAGYVGEISAPSTGTGTQVPTASGVWNTYESLTLSAGVWLVYGSGAIYWDGGGTAPTGFVNASFGLATAVNGTPSITTGLAFNFNAITTTSSGASLAVPPIVVSTNGTTNNIVYMAGFLIYTTVNSLVFDRNSTNIRAVRIA